MAYLAPLFALILVPGWIPGAVFLSIAACVLVSATGAEFSSFEVILLLSFIMALPVAAYLAGSLLDRYALQPVRGNTMSMPAAVLAMAVMLESDITYSYLSEMLLILSEGLVLKNIFLFLSVTNSAIFCGLLIALCLMLAQLLLELPVAWFSNAGVVRLNGTMAAIRPMLIILVFSLSVSLIAGLFVSELNPLTVLKGVERFNG